MAEQLDLFGEPLRALSDEASANMKTGREAALKSVRRKLATTAPLNPEGCLDTLEAVFSANDSVPPDSPPSNERPAVFLCRRSRRGR